MSGLQIFNAYPALHFGKSSYNGRPPVLEIGARQADDGALTGVTRVFGAEFDTTGYLGVTRDGDGQLAPSTFPQWLMLPGPQWLSMARSWHFFFAWLFVLNGLAYVLYAVGKPASRARPRAHGRGPARRSARRSATTCASGIRPARRQSATTCCRSSRI